jgi:1-acyl-sn-glycerol-3-phosphate acyltransferase
MVSDDRATRPDSGVLPTVRGRASRSARDVAGTLYGVACWVLFCVLGTLVWPAVLVLPKLSWRWKLVRATGRLLCACLAIPFETSGGPLAGEPCVYVANHASFLDSFAIGLMFSEPVVFVAGEVFSHQRVGGSFLRRMGAVFVGRERGNGHSSAESVLSAMEEVIRSGRSIVLFPEGGLTVTRELRRFHLGAFVVAAETGCPVVPVGILGTRAILRAGRRLPRRGAIHLVVGESLRPIDSGWKAAHQLADQAREAVEGLLGEG